jgi:hypothetical protein
MKRKDRIEALQILLTAPPLSLSPIHANNLSRPPSLTDLFVSGANQTLA